MPRHSEPIRQRRCLLIVEPEALLKWSLVQYLRRWFQILVADTEADAERLMNEHAISAVVVSGDLPNSSIQRIEAQALSGNPEILLIRTVTQPGDMPQPSLKEHRIEKPFALSEMAEILGICDDRSDPS